MARIALIAVSVTVVLFTVAFIVQARAGLTSDVYSFLLLGKDSIASIQRELGYKDLVGYDYTVKYLKENFGFTDVSYFDEPFDPSCVYRDDIHFHQHAVAMCLMDLSQYELVFHVETMKGNKAIVLTKNFSLISQYFRFLVGGLILIILLILGSFYLFYREFLALSIKPFFALYEGLFAKNSVVESEYLEIDEIGKRLREGMEREREIHRLKAITSTIEMTAHDIRKPLTTLMMFIKRVKRLEYNELVAYTERNLPEIERVAMDSQRIIDDLLDINRDLPIKIQPLELSSFLSGLTDVYYAQTPVEITGEPVVALADSAKLSRVVTNILNNAIEASPEPRRLWITVSRDEGKAVLEIGNTGSSIPSSDVRKVFRSFWTQKKVGGRGLGLAIARKFVEEHGGVIACESNGHCSVRGKVPRRTDEDYVIFKVSIPLPEEGSAAKSESLS